jgi:hypothetical protein
MSRHPSTEHLAEYAQGGVLGRRRTARVSSHLGTGCTRCNGQIVQLQQVTRVLTRTSMTFGPMPDQFSARIDLALASESTARVTSAPAAGEASRRDLPERGQQERRRGRRFPAFSSPLAGSLAAVGAAVVIAGGGYEIASNLNSGGAASSTSASAPQHSNAPAAVNRGAAGAAASGAPASVHFGPEVRFKNAGRENVIHSVQTDTSYGAASLVSKATAVLAAVRASNMAQASHELESPYATPAAAPVIGAAQLRECVARIAAGKDVLLVDVAKFDSKPAVIIITGTAPNGPGVIYAAGQRCSATNSDILDSLGFPRP